MRHLIVVFIVFAIVAPTQAVEIPNHPEALVFPSLIFEVPDSSALRSELANGIPVYALTDHQLPLVNITVFFRGGRYLEPHDKEGLAAITGQAWRTGGAGDRTARQLDEELDFLAARLSTDIGDVTGSVSLNVMSKDLEAATALLMDVLLSPQFQEDRLAKAQDDLIQAMRRRNDDIADIEAREWDRLLFGDEFWMNRLPTQQSVESITADDCRRFAARLIDAGSLVVAVSGDVDRGSLMALLGKTLGGLERRAEPIPAIPQPKTTAKPGVYVVHKDDVNQGRVSIGRVGFRVGHPDEFALRIMNDILGGGGFTSRITRRVRSDEGLAYSARSRLTFPVTIPGEFRASFQSKSSTCAYAAEIVNELINGIRENGITDDELKISMASYIETFPRRFETPARTVGVFASDEMLGRPDGYWLSYRDRIAEVSTDAARNAARKYLDPASMIMLVVGNIDEIRKGHPDHEVSLEDFGPVTRMPLRDPLTLEPIDG